MSARLLIAAILALFASPLAAQDRLPPAPYAYQQLNDPATEDKAKALMETPRCLVCQGPTIADSAATRAGDMQTAVRRKIPAGARPDASRNWRTAPLGTPAIHDTPFDRATAAT